MSETSQNWKILYKIGGTASLIYLVYSLVTMVLLMTIGGQPASAQEGFTMLAENRLAGLLRLDMLTIFIMPLYYLIFLGTYAALKKTNGAVALLATVLAFAGVTLFSLHPRSSPGSRSAINSSPRPAKHRKRCFWQRVRRSWHPICGTAPAR